MRVGTLIQILLQKCGPLHYTSLGHILSPCLFKLYAEYIMQNAGLDEAQAGIKIAGITSDMQMTPHLWQKVRKN